MGIYANAVAPVATSGMLRAMRPLRLLVLALAVSALALAGCKGKCRQLTEKLCECAVNTVDKQNCLTAASSREAAAAPTAADDARCEALLAGCDCHAIDTTKGKVACGLAKPLPDGGTP